MNNVLFDDSLNILVDTLISQAGQQFVEAGTALRDASGRLTFVADRPPRDEAERESLVQALQHSLGAYARTGRPIIFRGDAGAEPILAASDCLPIKVSNVFCRLVDRRIVGSGWLNVPTTNQPEPPRVVFATLKGGVGRSTAITIAAADFARRSRNVLVVDLDLEAPGLGNLLLDEEGTSDLGVIDYLVENGIGGIKEADLHLFIAPSKLTDAGGGRVDVMPAIGRRSIRNPANVLSKLSRAMIEDVIEGRTISVAEQISAMIARITNKQQYDAVFIDSRAGLAELAAPAVLGLGATVLLFGTAQKQTIEGYRALFAALQLLAQRDRDQNRDAEWRMKLRPVYAKAGLKSETANQFLNDIYEIYSEHIYDAEEYSEQAEDALRFAREDESAPHWPLTIPFSQNFVDFDPGRVPSQLTEAFYEQAFRPFITALEAMIAPDKTGSEPQP